MKVCCMEVSPYAICFIIIIIIIIIIIPVVQLVEAILYQCVPYINTYIEYYSLGTRKRVNIAATRYAVYIYIYIYGAVVQPPCSQFIIVCVCIYIYILYIAHTNPHVHTYTNSLARRAHNIKQGHPAGMKRESLPTGPAGRVLERRRQQKLKARSTAAAAAAAATCSLALSRARDI